MKWLAQAALAALALSYAATASGEDLFANVTSGKPDVVTISDGQLPECLHTLAGSAVATLRRRNDGGASVA